MRPIRLKRAAIRRGMWRDRRGVAMVEFALVLPVMLLLYLGGVQLQDAMACKRKVTITARAAADLIAQNTTGSTTRAEIQANMIAATQIMQPYATTVTQIRVTQISTDGNRRTTIKWSRGLNTQGYPTGAYVWVPAAMGAPNTTFLVAQVGYDYQPISTFGGVGAMSLYDILLMVPRNTDQITCTDC